MSQNYEHRLTPEQINYFAYVGKTYPSRQIIESKGRLFASFFEYNRSLIVAKVVNRESVQQMNSVDLTAYRKPCALVLGVEFSNGSKHLFDLNIPINPKSTYYPIYPEPDELLNFEIHFVDALTHELIRVVNFLPSDIDFTEAFVAEFTQLRELEYMPENYHNAAKKFFDQTHDSRALDKVLSTSCSIVKCDPEDTEVRLTGVKSLSQQVTEMPEEYEEEE